MGQLSPMAIAMLRAGISQKALAAWVKVRSDTISTWVRGEVSPQPNILAWVQALGNAIEKNPPPRWKSGRRTRSGNFLSKKGKNQNGQDAAGSERPGHSVTPTVIADEKHDHLPTEARRLTETGASGARDIGD